MTTVCKYTDSTNALDYSWRDRPHNVDHKCSSRHGNVSLLNAAAQMLYDRHMCNIDLWCCSLAVHLCGSRQCEKWRRWLCSYFRSLTVMVLCRTSGLWFVAVLSLFPHLLHFQDIFCSNIRDPGSRIHQRIFWRPIIFYLFLFIKLYICKNAAKRHDFDSDQTIMDGAITRLMFYILHKPQEMVYVK